MADTKVLLKEEKEECACEKMNIFCPFVEIDGIQDCQGCIFKVHTVKQLQDIVLGHYL